MAADGKRFARTAFTADDVARYHRAGWWSDVTLSDAVRRNAELSPVRFAYLDHRGMSLNWREFDAAADFLAGQLAGVGVAPGDRVAVWHGDAPVRARTGSGRRFG